MRTSVATYPRLLPPALNGELEAQRFPLKTLQYLGLAYCSDSEICLTTTALGTSRRHLSLECVDGRFVVADYGSTHGTFLNGERIVDGGVDAQLDPARRRIVGAYPMATVLCT